MVPGPPLVVVVVCGTVVVVGGAVVVVVPPVVVVCPPVVDVVPSPKSSPNSVVSASVSVGSMTMLSPKAAITRVNSGIGLCSACR